MSIRQVFYNTSAGILQDRSYQDVKDLKVKHFRKRTRIDHGPYNHHNEKTQVVSRLVDLKSPPKIWIIGASQICRAEPVAIKKYGSSFGLQAHVSWFGKGGMGWGGVLPRFYRALSSQTVPDVLVLHAGGNNLGRTEPHKLVSHMEIDLKRLKKEFPQMKIVFSCLHERKRWRYGSGPSMNKALKLVNRRLRKLLQKLKCEIVEHENIRFFHRGIFVPDGVHFTNRGNEIFLNNIHLVLKKVLGDGPKQNQGQTTQGLTIQVNQCPSKCPGLHVLEQDLRVYLQRKRSLDQSKDAPPQRRRRPDQPLYVPPQRRRPLDQSKDAPPQRRRHLDQSKDAPPQRRRRLDQSKDAPPQRRRHLDQSKDAPPQRRRRLDQSTDVPPQRRRHLDQSTDAPPQRRCRPDQPLYVPPQRRYGLDQSTDAPPQRKPPSS